MKLMKLFSKILLFFFFYPKSYVSGSVDEASQFANARCFHKLMTISSTVSILCLLLVAAPLQNSTKSAAPLSVVPQLAPSQCYEKASECLAHN